MVDSDVTSLLLSSQCFSSILTFVMNGWFFYQYGTIFAVVIIFQKIGEAIIKTPPTRFHMASTWLEPEPDEKTVGWVRVRADGLLQRFGLNLSPIFFFSWVEQGQTFNPGSSRARGAPYLQPQKKQCPHYEASIHQTSSNKRETLHLRLYCMRSYCISGLSLSWMISSWIVPKTRVYKGVRLIMSCWLSKNTFVLNLSR